MSKFAQKIDLFCRMRKAKSGVVIDNNLLFESLIETIASQRELEPVSRNVGKVDSDSYDGAWSIACASIKGSNLYSVDAWRCLCLQTPLLNLSLSLSLLLSLFLSLLLSLSLFLS